MKKFISWDIFHLSLILSLLRLYPELYRSSSYFENQPLEQEVFLGPSSAYTQTHFHNLNNRLSGGYIHPKNIDDSLLRSLFIHDLHSLSNRRTSWVNHPPQNDIIAYIVNGQQPLSSVNNNSNTTGTTNDSHHNQPPIEARVGLTEVNNIQSELTQEDMDLIEILWKQDIDLGISRNVFDGTWNQELNKEKSQVNASIASDKKESQPDFENPWQGLHYSIDSETGEHIILPPANPIVPVEQQNDLPLQEVPTTVDFADITLEEALQFFESESTETQQIKRYEQTERDILVNERQLSLLEELKDLQDLVAESRSNDSSWAEAMLLSQALGSNRFEIEPSVDSLTGSTPSYVDALLRNSSLPQAIEEQASTSDLSYNEQIEFSLNNEDEVDNILSMLANGTDPDPFSSIAAQYSGENPMDILPGNITTDNDLISSILSQESLDFMNLTRMVNESANAVFLASEDSAISSNESKHAMDWFGSSVSNQGDSACSDTNTNNTFGNRQNNRSNFATPVAQKKYHFFGKHTSDNESSNETSDSGCSNSVSSYPCSPKKGYNFVDYPKTPPLKSNAESLQPFLHNHTYHQAPTATQKPIERNKNEEEIEDEMKDEDKLDEERCRDEKRARELNLPLTIKEITCMPIEEFNERLTKLDLNEEQMTLVRDIRRRGKNKVAAQNCRKRKMDQIVNLQKRLEDLQYDRQKLMTEQASMSQHREFLQSKYHRLYQFLFEKTNSNPSEPPVYFSNVSPVEEQRPPDFPIGRNGTGFNQELEAESNKGARVKRKVNKNK